MPKLSKISNLSPEDAKNHLMTALTDEARTAAMATIKEITEEAKLNANKEARKIVIQSIQRVATEQAIENAVSVFNIESDEVKVYTVELYENRYSSIGFPPNIENSSPR